MHSNIQKVCAVENLRVFFFQARMTWDVYSSYQRPWGLRSLVFVHHHPQFVMLILLGMEFSPFSAPSSDVRLAGYLAVLHIVCHSDCRSTGRSTSHAEIWGDTLGLVGGKNHFLDLFEFRVILVYSTIKPKFYFYYSLILGEERRLEVIGSLFLLVLDIYLWLGRGCTIFNY